MLIGGCINGQLISWDLNSTEHVISEGRKANTEKKEEKNDSEEEDKSQQQSIKMKELIMSTIEKSHSAYVADIKFIPGGVKVDRKNPNDGKSYHFISIAEDGLVNIWDTRHIEISEMKILQAKGKAVVWVPFLSITVNRSEGGELGLSRILFSADQTLPVFWAASDEGELAEIDWSIRPVQTGEEAARQAEYVQRIYETERNSRPVLALERSPFYDDLLLTVHDFHFAIWKISLMDREEPIFRSANTKGSQNTCGAFSPTRPGVIFITKNNGIDIWDFYDQSNKPSIVMNLASQTITYFKFQPKYEDKGRNQLMAYGDEADGTLNLQEVAANLRQPQENEEEEIKNFWDNEVIKCSYVKERRVTMREQWGEKVKAEEFRKAVEEAKREQGEEVELEKEEKEEAAY